MAVNIISMRIGNVTVHTKQELSLTKKGRYRGTVWRLKSCRSVLSSGPHKEEITGD